MQRLTNEIIQFFQSHNFVIVSTIDPDGTPHSSCKGIVEITPKGRIYLLDLYRGKTFENLKQNPNISITAVDEHKFKGYCLKGRARIAQKDRLNPRIIGIWENKLTSRITHRFLKNIRGEKGHPLHPEALLPKPTYLIVMEAEKIVDLTPKHLK
ncbi:MAG: pyridoxamine 5'-phosphate oxidase family protein [Candidatus Omnitrophica bacterium]|nr:pyridoxamine 5'-phosphate oxidase family protein [Candidatus Omnitrophota bacterium]